MRGSRRTGGQPFVAWLRRSAAYRDHVSLAAQRNKGKGFLGESGRWHPQDPGRTGVSRRRDPKGPLGSLLLRMGERALSYPGSC